MRPRNPIETGQGAWPSDGELYATGVRATSAEYLSTVRTRYTAGRRNHRVLFGVAARTKTIASREGETVKDYYFNRGTRFALDLWSRNAYGTIQWRCFVCEAIGPGEEGSSVPGVAPGARVLLSTWGAAQSKLVLAWLDDLEGEGIDVLACPSALFEAAHLRLHGSRADKTPPQRLSGRL